MTTTYKAIFALSILMVPITLISLSSKTGIAGLSVQSTLQGFEANMTQQELQQAKQ
jgi:hypothetical protein